MNGEGINTPHARHKGRQPLIECAKHDIKIMYFPFFFINFYVFSIFIFIICFWSTTGCPCSYISSGAMRNSDLHSSLSLNVCCVTLFLSFFERLILIANKSC